MNSIGTPILTHITSTYLECTLHVAKYHCLLRLRSVVVNDDDTNNQSNREAKYVASPDISTLSAIPIQSKQTNTRIQNENDNIIRLLPKLFDIIHTKGRNINNTNNKKQHPSHELIRIAQSLEVQLKERLKDASDGAIANNNSMNMNDLSAANIQEEFLVRSEAVMCELLSAVQQQLQKEKSQSSISGGTDRNNSRKRKASSSSGQPSSTLSPPPLKYYSSLARQLSVLQSMTTVTAVSLHKQSSANSSSSGDENNTPADLTSLSVTCLDDQKRSHTWHAELYPSIVLTMDMPSEFVLEDKNIRLEKWWEDGTNTASNNTETLPRIQHHFEQALVKYQPLFNELDDLDAHLWILEPSLPARRCSVERRIALWEGGASMVIVLDPENARGVPVMTRFLGVTKATMLAAANASGDNNRDFVDWRTSFAEFVAEDNEQEDSKKKSQGKSEDKPANTKRWSEERSIRENLELWFGSPLPSPLAPSTDKSDFLVECGICYTHRLPTEEGSAEDGPLPEAKCSNPSCNRHYHESCLFEWLHSLPTAKISFDRLYGSCPYCTETLSVLLNNKR